MFYKGKIHFGAAFEKIVGNAFFSFFLIRKNKPIFVVDNVLPTDIKICLPLIRLAQK